MKSVKFIRDFRPDDSPINLVAIHPLTQHIKGITRNSFNPDLQDFINSYIATDNLYFAVNTPYSNAPDSKLNKTHIQYLNGLFIDKDQTADITHSQLIIYADELRRSEDQPTFAIDSGNGIQAFWLSKQPVLATDLMIDQFEKVGRGLAVKHQSDFIQNIDRIMRLPFTNNFPTHKKLKLGRKPTTTNLIYKTDKYYD